jgi:flavin-dependent dehydrogenase
VVVIGAGLSGLAACVLLREQGLRVVCLDHRPHPHRKVGESLDWSSPALLARLGIDTHALIADSVATWKRGIAVCERGAPQWSATPPSGMRRAPLRFETTTLHVDRTALDMRLYERARDAGTAFVWERVTAVEHHGGRITGCTTPRRRVQAGWYVDATGTARLFARALDIAIREYGLPKVCLWTYFDTAPLDDKTTFFVENREGYLQWVWDIPISPGRTSVGYVLPADEVRHRRRSGESVESILRGELARHDRFHPLLDQAAPLVVERTSFRPYVTATLCGVNWLMVGEAASMPDPLTGNGVTSGIRHARHAADAIRRAGPGGLSPRQQRAYASHVLRLGQAFNAHIEQAIYQPRLRRRFGLRTATYVYTFFAFFTNALHNRFDPRGPAGMAAVALLFGAARAWIAGWMLMARVPVTTRVAGQRPGVRGSGDP